MFHMDDLIKESFKGEVQHCITEAYVYLLQAICAYQQIKDAAGDVLERGDKLLELKKLPGKYVSSAISHLSQLTKSFNDIWENGGYKDAEGSIYTILVSKLRLQACSDVASRSVLTSISKKERDFDTERAFYNTCLLWLQSLSPDSIEWHFHLRNDDDDDNLRICARLQNLSRKQLENSVALISYLLEAITILGNSEDREGLQGRPVLRISHHCRDEMANCLKRLLTFSFVNSNLPLVGFEFKTVNCKHASAFLPSLEPYRKISAEYNTGKTLLASSASLMTTLICQAVILIHREKEDKIPVLLDLSVLCFVTADKSGNVAALDILYRILLDYMKTFPQEVRRHANVLEPALIMRRSMLSRECVDTAKCVEFYVWLMVTLMSDADHRLYEVLESFMDQIMLFKGKDVAVTFLRCYSVLLDSAPLACSATLLQLFDLLISTVDAKDCDSLMTALCCIQSVFVAIPEDANTFSLEICHWFIIPFMLHLRNATISKVNCVICAIRSSEEFTFLKIKPMALEDDATSQDSPKIDRHELLKQFSTIWSTMHKGDNTFHACKKILELKNSLEGQLRTDGVAAEAVLEISQYYSWLLDLNFEVTTDV